MKDSETADDSTWFLQVFSKFEGPLLRYAFSLTRNMDQARDVVQETFLRLWKVKRSKVEPRVLAWLFTVCRNRIVDVYRKEKRMETQSQEELDKAEDSMPETSKDSEQNERSRKVWQVLRLLPQNQQEIVRLKFQNDLSYREIAEITGLSVSNVGVLLHYALLKLREHFKEVKGNEKKVSGRVS